MSLKILIEQMFKTSIIVFPSILSCKSRIAKSFDPDVIEGIN